MRTELTLTAMEIRTLGLKKSDVLGYDYEYKNGRDNNYLLVNEKRFISFNNWKDREKTYRKINRMGLGLGWKAPQLTDEERGIIQASKNGENPFAFSMLCANPEMNITAK